MSIFSKKIQLWSPDHISPAKKKVRHGRYKIVVKVKVISWLAWALQHVSVSPKDARQRQGGNESDQEINIHVCRKRQTSDSG